MSTYIEKTWPIMAVGAVVNNQTLPSAGALDLTTGTLYNANRPNQVSFIAQSFIRSVSITSTSNLSAVTFTVTGLQNNAFVTETITGPNNSTVYGTKYYDIITSVIVNGAVTNVSVGTGNAGYLPIVAVNTNNVGGNVNYSCSVLLSAGAGITYSLKQTLESVTTNWIAFQNQSNNFFAIPGMSGFIGATTSQIGNSTAITNYLLLNISSSTTPLTDTLNFIFLQE